MLRFRKLLVLLGAAALALLLTIERRGQGIRIAAEPSLSAAVHGEGSSYQLSQAQIFSKTLYYVNSQYFDRTRPEPKRMLVGALDFLQRDVPEVLIDRFPEREPRQVTVRVNGEQKIFPIERVDSPWSLRSTIKEIFAFIEPRLRPVPEKDRARHLVDIEMTATNGMLYTLDPHSVLLDIDSFKDMRTTTQGKFGGLGIVIEMDRKSRITVKKPMPDTPAIRIGIKAKDHIVRINNESTMNMTLQEAVDRLRGEVGSPVDVYIERTGLAAPKKFTIVRDYIRPPAIDPPPRVLSVAGAAGQPGAKVGYFRIVSFSANTESDLAKALGYFEREKVKGIVMDLRGNPGGLYDQAQKVADAFIDEGVLVSMVGPGGSQRKDEHATRGGDTRAAAGRAGQPDVGQRVRDRRRRPQESGPRRHHRRGHVRQRLGADALRHSLARAFRQAERRGQAGPQAHDGAIPHAGRRLHPGGGGDPRHRAGPHARREEERRGLDQPAAVHQAAAGIGLRVAPREPQRAEGWPSTREGFLPVCSAARQGYPPRR